MRSPSPRRASRHPGAQYLQRAPAGFARSSVCGDDADRAPVNAPPSRRRGFVGAFGAYQRFDDAGSPA
jgi:hypothetical protein